jgi:hypothetical protein
MLTWNISLPDKDNIVRTPGIETGKVEWWYPTNLSRVDVGSFIVLKFHGGMFWAARGEQRYSSTKFMLLQVTKITEDHPNYKKLFVCAEVLEFPLRREK